MTLAANHTGKFLLQLGPTGKSPVGEHWQLGTDIENIAWLVLDRAGASANTLSRVVLEELDRALDALIRDTPRALVVRSAKPSGFVAGADITEFQSLADANDTKALLEQGHAILERLEALSFPTIAVVHGYALGGGFELALACDYRIAVEGASFGFPEVRLGLHPGLGGSFRLTELIDPVEAMTMMLTGSNAHTKKAEALGIVDVVVPERHVLNAVRAMASGEVDRQTTELKGAALRLTPARKLAAARMRKKTDEKANREHYPAPYALIDLWETHGGDREAMQRAEIESFATLLGSATARNLIRVYFLRESLKSRGEGESGIRHVHVIGAGAMGGEIAAWCAIQGLTVTLVDQAHAALANAMQAAKALCGESHLSAAETRDTLDRLMPDPRGYGLSRADLVIEAVPEKLDLKRSLYADIEPQMKAGALLTTNTSSLELPELTQGLADPSRFAGLHFFNPVAKMQLVEVVRHNRTDDASLKRLRAFTTSISRLPAPVSSYPGFLVNRALMPYLMEALALLDEGHDKAIVDRAAEGFGMPMGPIELADRVGLDICLHVANSLAEGLDKPLAPIPQWLHDKVEAGELGRKAGKGFYEWIEGNADKRIAASIGEQPEDMVDRLILPMLDACTECLREGVVDDTDLVDGAMVFATGFAPFRGGPMHYAQQRGIHDVTATLQRLADEHGARFAPDAGWSLLAECSGRTE